MTVAEKHELSTHQDLVWPNVCADYRMLDAFELPLRHFRIITPDTMDNGYERLCPIERVLPSSLGQFTRRLPVMADFLLAIRTLRVADSRTAIVCNGGQRVGKLVALLNHWLPVRRRKVVMWETFVEANSLASRFLVRGMVRGSSVCLVYSQRQVSSIANYLNVSPDKFMYMPYKANHSKWPPIDLPVGDYVFSGGNSGRDYETLFEAVRGTNIPVIISTSLREVNRLNVPENVIVLTAHEPAFARLMAGSRFVVLPIEKGLVRSAANAGICNAMWHGKPVISADDISLSDYTLENETGHVVPAGDVESLRNRIVDLWNHPRRAAEMGQHAQVLVRQKFTHQLFHQRLGRLAAVLAASTAGQVRG